MARTESMAAIDAALSGQQNLAGPEGSPGGTDEPIAEPHAAPGVAAPAPVTGALTADQKRAIDVARQERRDQEAAAKGQLREQQAQFASQQQEEQQARGAFTRAALGTVAAARRIGRATAIRVESLPDPGGIVFPLLVLLVFFFLLIPVNGHTRAMWLWLVLTGNASIGQGSGASVSGGPVTGLPIGQTAGAVQSSVNAAAGGVQNTVQGPAASFQQILQSTAQGAAGSGNVQQAIQSAINGIIAFAGNETPQ